MIMITRHRVVYTLSFMMTTLMIGDSSAAEYKSPQQHIQGYYDAMDSCAGSSDPKVQEKGCAARDQHSNWLKEHGWC